jgi:hypothetical protein
VKSSLPRKIFYIYAAAVAMRLLFVLLYPGVNYYSGITGEYLDATTNLLTGHGLSAHIDIASYSSGQIHFAYLPFIGRPLGYVLYFAAIALITGVAPIAFQIGQALIMGCVVFLVYRLAQLLFHKSENVERIAIAATWLAALWPNAARFDVVLLPDGFTTLIMLALAISLTRFMRDRSMKHLATTGLILAGSIYLRPDLVLFPVFLGPALFFLLPWKKAIGGIATIVLILAVAIGINTWKNYALSGEIVPLNLGSGTTMYEGISQFGDTLGTTYADERVAHNKLDAKQLFYPNGKEHDQMLFKEAIDTIEHHPLFYASVVLRRIPLMFTVRGLFFSDSVSFSKPGDDLSQRFPGKYIAMFKEAPVATTVRFLSPILGWLLIVVAVIGMIKAWRNSREEHIMVLLILVYFILSHLATNVEPRYFYPALPLLYGYAVFALLKLGRGTKPALSAKKIRTVRPPHSLG